MRFKDQRISITEINYAIRWIVIYPVDSAIQRLNNRGQNYTRLFLKGRPGKNWSPPMRHLFEWPGPPPSPPAPVRFVYCNVCVKVYQMRL